MWPDSWLRCGGAPPAAADAAAFAARWVRSHAAEAAARLRKPLLVSEFGTPDAAARAAFFATLYAVVERALGATDGAADECKAAGDGALAGSCLWMVAHPGYPGDGMEVTLPCAPLPAFCNAGVCSSGDNAANAAALAEIARHAATVRAWNEAQHASCARITQR